MRPFFMATIDDIASRAQVFGKVTRTDILEVLEVYHDAANEQENISSFIDLVGIVSLNDKQKILADLNSYPVSYPR